VLGDLIASQFFFVLPFFYNGLYFRVMFSTVKYDNKYKIYKIKGGILMFHHLVKKIDQKNDLGSVGAHCDIPCGIYDPHHAQVAALTVIRMMDLISGLVKEHGQGDTAEFINSMARYVAVKEGHAELVKHKIGVI